MTCVGQEGTRVHGLACMLHVGSESLDDLGMNLGHKHEYSGSLCIYLGPLEGMRGGDSHTCV